jgi:hypothetical protein
MNLKPTYFFFGVALILVLAANQLHAQPSPCACAGAMRRIRGTSRARFLKALFRDRSARQPKRAHLLLVSPWES